MLPMMELALLITLTPPCILMLLMAASRYITHQVACYTARLQSHLRSATHQRHRRFLLTLGLVNTSTIKISQTSRLPASIRPSISVGDLAHRLMLLLHQPLIRRGGKGA